MGCLITKSLVECRNYSIGGINRILFANKSQIPEWYSQTGITEQSIITSFTTGGSFSSLYEISFDQESTSFTEQLQKGNNGNAYVYSMTVQLIKNNNDKRDLINQLNNSELVVIFLDNNGYWRLIGEESKLRVKEYESTTGNNSEANRYRFVVRGTSRYPARYLSSGYVRNSPLFTAYPVQSQNDPGVGGIDDPGYGGIE